MAATANRRVEILEQEDAASGNGAASATSVVIARRYAVELDSPLGQGGMALVYRGRDLKTRREVALKTLRLEYRNNPETRARFRQEIRRMAFLDHPNVAKVFDLLEEPEAPWAVMEYVRGRSLKEVIAERGPFKPAEAAEVLEQTADALDHIHGHGLVHLDVKPQNLLVTPDETIKLIDFGLAQPAGSSQELIGGTTFGTAAYLSPEQAAGEKVDRTADVYAVGCVLYEMLTGRPPFLTGAENGNNGVKNDVIRAHLEVEPTPPSKVRPDLGLTTGIDDVVLWALAKDPHHRVSDAPSLARLFRAAVDTMGAAKSGNTVPLGLHEVPWGAEPEKQTPTPIAVRKFDRPIQARSVVHADGRRPLHSQVYRLGGRMARRTAWLRRGLWRVTLAVAVANLVLALAVYARHGSDGLLGREPTLKSGGEAEVVTQDLRVRDAPGLSTITLAILEPGTDLTITGQSETVDDRVWWPIRLEVDGTRIEGYVWEGGIEPAGGPGLGGTLRDGFDNLNGLFT